MKNQIREELELLQLLLSDEDQSDNFKIETAKNIVERMLKNEKSKY